MSLRFVPPLPTPIFSPKIGAEAATAHRQAPRRRKNSPSPRTRPPGQVLRPKEIWSPGWLPTTPKGKYQVPGPPARARAPDEKSSPGAEFGKKKNTKRYPMSLKLLQNPSLRIVLSFACKKWGQNSKCSVVTNSPSAEFGKFKKKLTNVIQGP